MNICNCVLEISDGGIESQIPSRVPSNVTLLRFKKAPSFCIYATASTINPFSACVYEDPPTLLDIFLRFSLKSLSH